MLRLGINHSQLNKKLAWDDPLPAQDEIKWLKIDKDLKKLSYCDIPRYIGLEGSDKPTSQFLVFCDAFKYAYAATVYLRQRTGHRYTKNLIFSKARLAPNQDVSIPRLELLSSLIGVRCIIFEEKELEQKCISIFNIIVKRISFYSKILIYYHLGLNFLSDI